MHNKKMRDIGFLRENP